MAKKFSILPKNPERICWGCDKYCRTDDLQCGSNRERIQHPIEVDGQDWYKKNDRSNLLSDQQRIEPGLKEAPPAEAVVKIEPKTAKPHTKLPSRNKTVWERKSRPKRTFSAVPVVAKVKRKGCLNREGET